MLLGMGGAAALANPLGTFAGLAQSPNGAAVKVEKDVLMGKGGDTDLRCDIYKPPPGTEKRMALVHLHGGGLVSGSKDTLAVHVTPITARGYVSIAAEYRLTGVAKWPAQLDDVKTAIRWTRTNADRLGIDPHHIAAVGYSAGGHLVLSAASTGDTNLAACVGFYPAVVVAMDKLQALLQSGVDPTKLPDAMPLDYEFKGFPPTIIFHGLADVVVPRKAANTCFTSFAAREFRPNSTPSPGFRMGLTLVRNLPKPARHLPTSFSTGTF